MRRARLSRGHDPRFLWQVGATAAGSAALFVRSYERGERVHLAMLSRGFDGAMPQRGRGRPEPAPVGHWPGPAPGSRVALAAAGWAGVSSVIAHRDLTAHGRPRRGPGCRRRWRSRGSPSPTPTGTRPCSASTCASSPVSGSRCSARTARARRRSCCTSTASCAPAPGRVRSAGCRWRRRTCGRSAAGSGSSSRTPTTSCSCRRSATTSRSGRPTSACPAPRCANGSTPRWPPSTCSPTATAPRCTCPAGSGAGSRWPPCSPCRPEILVLDEPSSNLDPVARRELAEVLLARARGGAPACSWSPTTCPTRCSCARAA